MIRTVTLCLAVLPGAAWAQDGQDDAPGLIERGMRMMMEGLIDEMAPALDQLRNLTDQLDAYEAPEVLPNGDIIIRRKTPLAPGDAPDAPLEELEL